MKKRIGVTLCIMFTACITMVAQSEPILTALNMPRYPWLAVQGRAQGLVKVAFTLRPHADEPTKVELISGTANDLLKNAALENVKTWRFANSDAAEHRYEVTFEFQLEGKQVVSFQSFRYVTVVFGDPPIIAN
jgi:hypothetical protein